MASPLEIRQELERLARLHGGVLTPEAVVKAARPKSSVLHSRFEWDDSDAAEKYRLWQARQLMRVVVQYEAVGTREPVEVRVMTSLSTDRSGDTRGYRVTTAVLEDPAHRAQLLADAKEEMRKFQAKYQQLTELAEVFIAMENVIGAA